SMHQEHDAVQEVISQFDLPETPPVRKPHFLDAEPRKVEAAAPRSPGEGPAKSPFAKALFDLEQGGRS
ncbi:hypothetical protein ABTK47_19860, partial [Acinetobacter baumannii]